MNAKNMNTAKVNLVEIETYFEICETEKMLKAEFGKSFETFKHIRVELMRIMVRKTGQNFDDCCFDHLKLIENSKRSDKTKQIDYLFMMLLVLENNLIDGSPVYA